MFTAVVWEWNLPFNDVRFLFCGVGVGDYDTIESISLSIGGWEEDDWIDMVLGQGGGYEHYHYAPFHQHKPLMDAVGKGDLQRCVDTVHNGIPDTIFCGKVFGHKEVVGRALGVMVGLRDLDADLRLRFTKFLLATVGILPETYARWFPPSTRYYSYHGIIKFVVNATRRWHYKTHLLHHVNVRNAVRTVLMVVERLKEKDELIRVLQDQSGLGSQTKALAVAPAVWVTPFNSPAEAVAFNASLAAGAADALPASSDEEEGEKEEEEEDAHAAAVTMAQQYPVLPDEIWTYIMTFFLYCDWLPPDVDP